MAYNPKVLLVALAGLTFAAPQIASACHDVTLCFAWPMQIEDQEYGELHIVDEKVPAHGARVTLIRPPPEVALNRILDDNGCVTFETQYAFGHMAVLHAEAWIDDGTTAWHFRTLLEKVDTNFDIEKEPRYWPIFVKGIAANESVEIAPSENALMPAAEIMGISTEIMKRLVLLGVMPPTPALPSFDQIYVPSRDNAFADCDGVAFGKGRYRNKNIAGHEFGHWLQCQWSAQFEGRLAYEYGETDEGSPEDPCLFYDKQHALRSAEWSTPAMNEGFGHFISAVLFNDHLEPDAEAFFSVLQNKISE